MNILQRMADKNGYIDINCETVFYNRLKCAEPTVMRCIGCGRCVATCSAAYNGKFNFRNTLYGLRRGYSVDIKHSLKSCMLCSKCTMICPYGVNVRNAIISLNTIVLR